MCVYLPRLFLPLAATMSWPKTVFVYFLPPLFPKGYDFQFLRSSRLYEECGNATGFSWTTQLVGEEALAVCSRECSSDMSARGDTSFLSFVQKNGRKEKFLFL